MVVGVLSDPIQLLLYNVADEAHGSVSDTFGLLFDW